MGFANSKRGRNARGSAMCGRRLRISRGEMGGKPLTPRHELAYRHESATLPVLEARLAAIDSAILKR